MPVKLISIVYNKASYVYMFRLNLIKKLQEKGYQIIVITPYDDYVKKLAEINVSHMPIKMSQFGINSLKEINKTYQIYKALS